MPLARLSEEEQQFLKDHRKAVMIFTKRGVFSAVGICGVDGLHYIYRLAPDFQEETDVFLQHNAKKAQYITDIRKAIKTVLPPLDARDFVTETTVAINTSLELLEHKLQYEKLYYELQKG